MASHNQEFFPSNYFSKRRSKCVDENKDPYNLVNYFVNSILHIDRTSRNCNITRVIHIASTVLSAIETDVWRPRQENVLLCPAFLFNEDSESLENICNFARLKKSLNEFLSTHNWSFRTIDLWNKMKTARETIGIRTLIKEHEENKVWIWIKLLIKIK